MGLQRVDTTEWLTLCVCVCVRVCVCVVCVGWCVCVEWGVWGVVHGVVCVYVE